jgi:hypothetical protein
MKLQIPIPADPQRSMFRLPHVSIKNMAGTFIATKMTYWIELETRFALPLRPAM